MRINVLLRCTVCEEENYLTPKNKRNNPDRLELKKYCPRCRKQTVHREKTKR
ncbi:MAG: 50S ribosomal protein L33 [Bacilli bacterium]|jgi:large subunit ribosomal protein L33|nr:50S ribosomal protein L33 [Acholeplasmataceae bacterium]